MSSAKIVKNVHVVTEGVLAEDEWVEVEGTITWSNGKITTCKSAGYFAGVHWDGDVEEGEEETLYVYLRGGYIGETDQKGGMHGFPLSQLEMEESEYSNLREVGEGSDVWVSGDNRFVLAFVETEPEAFVYYLLDKSDGSVRDFVAESVAKSYVLRQSV